MHKKKNKQNKQINSSSGVPKPTDNLLLNTCFTHPPSLLPSFLFSFRLVSVFTCPSSLGVCVFLPLLVFQFNVDYSSCLLPFSSRASWLRAWFGYWLYILVVHLFGSGLSSCPVGIGMIRDSATHYYAPLRVYPVTSNWPESRCPVTPNAPRSFPLPKY